MIARDLHTNLFDSDKETFYGIETRWNLSELRIFQNVSISPKWSDAKANDLVSML